MTNEDWAALRADIKCDRDTYYEQATDLADEGKDAERQFGRVDALDAVLGWMDEAELDAATKAGQ